MCCGTSRASLSPLRPGIGHVQSRAGCFTSRCSGLAAIGAPHASMRGVQRRVVGGLPTPRRRWRRRLQQRDRRSLPVPVHRRQAYANGAEDHRRFGPLRRLIHSHRSPSRRMAWPTLSSASPQSTGSMVDVRSGARGQRRERRSTTCEGEGPAALALRCDDVASEYCLNPNDRPPARSPLLSRLTRPGPIRAHVIAGLPSFAANPEQACSANVHRARSPRRGKGITRGS
jgi:hypothetical protein